jgi:hypothetical protein
MASTIARPARGRAIEIVFACHRQAEIAAPLRLRGSLDLQPEQRRTLGLTSIIRHDRIQLRGNQKGCGGMNGVDAWSVQAGVFG